MKNFKKGVCLSLALAIFFSFASCGNKGTSNKPPVNTSSGAVNDPDNFTYSGIIDENGFWKDIVSTDCIEMFEYKGFNVPKDVHTVTDEAVQEQINQIMLQYKIDPKKFYEGVIKDGDYVNIDYVGTIDGVEFEGGSSNGQGYYATAGSEEFIDDFLTQIIGHEPGDKFDVTVTFPEVYENAPEFAGKDAVFAVTINYIADFSITDEYVYKNLYELKGWATVSEMKAGLRKDIQKSAIQNYIGNYLANDVVVNVFPAKIIAYQEDALIYTFRQYSTNNSVEMSELFGQEEVSNEQELIEKYRSENEKNARYSLAVQAVAEKEGITVTEEDMLKYMPNYETVIEQYGISYLKQYFLGMKVMDFIVDNAKLA